MNAQAIIAEIEKLPHTEQMGLYEALYPIIYQSPNNVAHYLKDIREAKFAGVPQCPHCGSESIKGHGKYRNRQRYKCKSCNRTFNDTTASPMAGTHYPQKWAQHIKLMVEEATLQSVADELGIHISTAFYWRHKVMNALNSIEPEMLAGLVESDEKFFLESHKGKNQVIKKGQRKPRKRGGKAKLRGLSREQICVVIAMDRDGHIASKTAGRGKITAKQIDNAIGQQISNNSVLCTDSARNYTYFAKQKNLKHVSVNGSKKQYVVEKIYHIQNVNSYHGRLEDWINHNFKGVATKNIDKYLSWKKFLEQNKHLDKNKLKRMLLTTIFKPNVIITTKQLRPA